MAVGISTTKIVGRLVFDLERDEEKTTRTIDIPNALTETSMDSIQSAVNAASALFTNATTHMNIAVQPANWRDTNQSETQWTTTALRYEIVSTTTTPIEPE